MTTSHLVKTPRIDHRGHDHPNTKRARAICRAEHATQQPSQDHEPTLELVWRPSPDVEKIVMEIPISDLEAVLAGRP